jgi:hypothetical protein
MFISKKTLTTLVESGQDLNDWQLYFAQHCITSTVQLHDSVAKVIQLLHKIKHGKKAQLICYGERKVLSGE